MLERAREAVAGLVGAAPDAVVFTSGGTEANNQVLGGIGSRCLVSAIEHDSVLAAAPGAERLPVDGEGRIELARLAERLAAVEPALVSVMLANNETGVIQPIAEVAELAHRHGALVHCDAVQAAGKLPIDLRALGVDFLTLSAHKLGGPQGVGALVLGEGIEPAALLRGGGQERRWRPGTENCPASSASAAPPSSRRRTGAGARGRARCATGSRPRSWRRRPRPGSTAAAPSGSPTPAASACPGSAIRPS